ncbi:MAG: hypothetical protein KDE27_04640 [Planctomycetes bacterium]|nr:hypothetical protein [Planctomycetota bacterium]
MLPLAAVLGLLATVATAQDPAAIVAGIQQVTPTGGPGAIAAFPGAGVVPLVSGDDDTTQPSLFAAVGSLGTPGSGHVLAVGHEGLLGDTANGLYDTLQFNLQALDWLDGANTRRLAILSGHAEWANRGDINVLGSALTGAGWTIVDVPGVVTSMALAGAGVVVVGNAWSALQTSELAALESHVAAGGGLYLAGLGWSWPGDSADYPMNAIGASYGIGWLPTYLTDPTNNHNGSVLFHTFYPACDAYGTDGALAHLSDAVFNHPADLDTWLQGNATARTEFVAAAALAVTLATELPVDGGVRAALDAELRDLMEQNPQWFTMAGTFDPAQDAALAVVRAGLGAAIVGAFDLDAQRLAVIEPALGITDPAVDPDYATILREHGFLLLDNRGFGAQHRGVILDLMASIPSVPRDLQRMTCVNELANDPALRQFPFPGRGVNVFAASAIQTLQNQFPADTAPRNVPVFATTVCHEVAHVIDSYLLRSSPKFATRRDALLQAAGLDDLQYLRSQIGGQFFQSNPQEFVASLANEWNTDSLHTLRLGVLRFAAGKAEPIRQALLMADVYGHDGVTTPLYTMASTGRITVTQASIGRDIAGNITSICDGTTEFRFTWDAQGNALSATETAGTCTGTWQDLGSGLAGVDGVPVAAGGGEFIAGQPIAVHLAHAAPSSLAAIVIGFARIDQPFFGGTLVPRGDFTVLVVSDADGDASFTLQWPSGFPSGHSTYFQYWGLDAAAALGAAASNGLRGVTP